MSTTHSPYLLVLDCRGQSLPVLTLVSISCVVPKNFLYFFAFFFSEHSSGRKSEKSACDRLNYANDSMSVFEVGRQLLWNKWKGYEKGQV